MTMISITSVKATMTAKYNSSLEIFVALVAVIVGIIVKQIADRFLPQRAIGLGKHAVAGFLHGWYVRKASNGCKVSPEYQARATC